MFSTLRTRFGIPGVISVIALVFAMLGGAYAANNTSGGKATASKAKAKKGPRGPRGPKGSTGSAGPQGPAGAKGDAGAAGSNGSNGQDGADGQSVTGESIAAGGACGAGVTGVKYTLGATSTNVCNGKNGTTGFTETLPSGKTETGMWGVTRGNAGVVHSPVSFSIPLAESPDLVFVAMVNWEEFGTEFFNPELEQLLEEAAANGCPGFNAEGMPLADPGTLCVYGNFMTMKPGGTGIDRTKLPAGPDQIFLNGGFKPKPEEGGEPGGSGTAPGAGPMGTTLNFICTASCEGRGAWAVTAE